MKKALLVFLMAFSLLGLIVLFGKSVKLPSPPDQPVQITPSPTAEAITCTVTAFETLNLRAQPGTSAAVIAVLKRGEVVTILPHPSQENWIPVTAGGLHGWINSNFCKGQ